MDKKRFPEFLGSFIIFIVLLIVAGTNLIILLISLISGWYALSIWLEKQPTDFQGIIEEVREFFSKMRR